MTTRYTLYLINFCAIPNIIKLRFRYRSLPIFLTLKLEYASVLRFNFLPDSLYYILLIGFMAAHSNNHINSINIL